MRRNDGITLIELIIVLAILGIFAAMSVPSFLDTIRKNELRSAAQNMADLINYTKNESLRRGQVAFVYPAYFRSHGRLNGQATSWEDANGLVAFIDNLEEHPDGAAIYNGHSEYSRSEEIRSLQFDNSRRIVANARDVRKIRVEANKISSIDNPHDEFGELGLVIYPNGELKISDNFNSRSTGNSGYMARIVLRNRHHEQICHVLWVDNLARARSCPVGVRHQSVPQYVQNICYCSSSNE